MVRRRLRLLQQLQRRLGHLFCGYPKRLGDRVTWGGDAEAVDADGDSVAADVALPAEGCSGFHRDARGDGGGQDGVAVGFVLGVEEVEARHVDYTSGNPFAFEHRGGGERGVHFGAGGDEDRAGSRRTLFKHVAALQYALRVAEVRAVEGGQVLAA